MLEHNEHDKTKKETLHLDLRVNGKLHRKTGTTAILIGRLQLMISAPVRHAFTQSR